MTNIVSSNTSSCKQRHCSKCGDPYSASPKNSGSYCNPCRAAYMRENRKQGKYSESFDRKRDANLRANHDMTLEEYNLQLFQQGGVCAICKQPETLIDGYTGKPRNLCVDHHHGLKINRELLCLNCNLIVGWIEQDRDRVQKVMKYLKRHDN